MSKPWLRVRSTTLNAMAWFYAPPRDGADTEEKQTKWLGDLIDALCGETKETQAMRNGTRFHKIMQLKAQGKDHLDEITFDNEEADSGQVLLKPDLTEFQVTQSIEGLGCPHRIVLHGTIDAMAGTTIVDYKTTGKGAFKDEVYERLADSAQWRTYLTLVPHAEMFRYEVFQIAPLEIEEGTEFVVKTHQSYDFRRYAHLERDMHETLIKFSCLVRDLEERGDIWVKPNGQILRGSPT